MPFKNFRASLLSKYVGEQYLGNIDAALSKLDGYCVNDINIQYTLNDVAFAKSITITALVNNILNEKYIKSDRYFYW